MGRNIDFAKSAAASGDRTEKGLKLTGFQLAVALCLLIPAAYTLVAIFFPPSLSFDAGVGFFVWRSLLDGAPLNTHWIADRQDIAIDHPLFLSWWSPGQYAVPGILSLTGLPIGASIAVTCGISLSVFLFGCVNLLRYFALSSSTTVWAIIFLSTFRYSTLPFGIYSGEILLQGALPWLILMALRVPAASLAKGTALAFAVVMLGFFVKLTGIVVAGAALIAACVPVFWKERRIAPGMIGGVCGSALALAALYFVWFSQGETPGTVSDGGALWEGVSLSLVGPLVAGFAPLDLMAWLFLHPSRPIFSETWPLMVLATPIAASIAALLLLGKKTIEAQKLIVFALLFYVVFAVGLSLVFLRGGDVSVAGRHARAPGILLFLCAMAVLAQYQWRHPVRLLFTISFSFFSIYGIASFASRTFGTSSADRVESYSRTTQLIVGPDAIEFIRSAYEREGRRALFVLPTPEVVVALPIEARTLLRHIDFQTVEHIDSVRFDGAVDGNLYIVIQRRLADGPKGQSLRASFVQYDRGSWQFRDFGDTRIYFQHAAAPSGANRE